MPRMLRKCLYSKKTWVPATYRDKVNPGGTTGPYKEVDIAAHYKHEPAGVFIFHAFTSDNDGENSPTAVAILEDIEGQVHMVAADQIRFMEPYISKLLTQECIVCKGTGKHMNNDKCENCDGIGLT